METCNTISIDIDRLYKDIQQACLDFLNDVADRVIDEFSMAIYKDGAGRHEWRANAAQEFQKLSEEMTEDAIQITVGLRDGIEAEARSNVYMAQVMVALFGNHPPIATKPGSEVYKDHMLSRGTSTAKTVYQLPQFGWADPHADKMLDNSLKKLHTYFKNGMSHIIRGIKFSDYVYVTKR